MIKFKQKEMNALTAAELESYLNSKVYYICGKED